MFLIAFCKLNSLECHLTDATSSFFTLYSHAVRFKAYTYPQASEHECDRAVQQMKSQR